ncbi:MAG: hypothetical protein DRQ78_05530 [Epsilonproteobacteria bacterium]|nr:MAG: hypothetical protein DRQ78_05530 [Campylobacterota bacterium]
MSDLNSYKERSIDAIEELENIKGLLHEDVSNVQVKLDEDANPQIARAITEVFGEMKENDPRKGYITFDMYMQCLRIIRAAGQAKASSILEREFI